jgi:hypothetical protein
MNLHNKDRKSQNQRMVFGICESWMCNGSHSHRNNYIHHHRNTHTRPGRKCFDHSMIDNMYRPYQDHNTHRHIALRLRKL